MKEKMKNKLKIFGRTLLCVFIFGMMFSLNCLAQEVHMDGTLDYAKAYEVLQLTNQQRANAGASELKMNQSLQTSAMMRAQELAIVWDHTRPNDQSFGTAITVAYNTCGENIAYGQTTASSVVTDWMNSTTGHRENLLNTKWNQIGIGCYYHNGTYYWVQLFIDTAGTSSYVNKSVVATPAIVEVNPGHLDLWANRADNILCARTVVYGDLYETVQMVPIHYNNNGKATVLYASDFDWAVNSSFSQKNTYLQIVEKGGQYVFVKGLQSGGCYLYLYDFVSGFHAIHMSFSHTHKAGSAATCTTAQTCTTCGEVLTEALGHAETGGCTTNVTCVRCGIVLSGPVGHTPGPEATCTTDQKCTKCSTILKSRLYHTYPPRNCLEELHCSRCGYMRYKAYEQHYWSGTKTFYKAATVTSPALYKQKCLVCEEYQLVKSGSKLKATLKLNVSRMTLKKKQAFAGLTATMANGDTLKSVKSNKTSVLKVTGFTADGTIRLKAGNKTGTAKLTITTAAGAKKTLTVKVQKGDVKTTKIKNVSTKLTLKKGASRTLKPVLQPIYSTQKITYKTSNKKVATVSSKGVIKARKKGKATIAVKSGSRTVKCKVTVK